MTRSYDAVVLAGGAARRLGGADKPALSVGGRVLLDRVLGACGGAARTVVVGPRRPTARPVRWTREEPPGGGPLPALAAGLAALDSAADTAPGSADRPDVVVVLAADLPFLTAETVGALADALTTPDKETATDTEEDTDEDTDEDTEREGVMLTDSDGRDQPLAAAYRIEPLRRELALLRAEHGGLTGLPLRLLTAELRLRRIPDPTGEASFDCDTWEDVAVARARLDTGTRLDPGAGLGTAPRPDPGTGPDAAPRPDGGPQGVSLSGAGARIGDHGPVLDEWIAAAKTELGIDLDVDTRVLLDLARDAAHGVDRPAAPLTTFLVGYAAARAGGGPDAVREAAAKAAALARRWAEESGGDTDPAR